MPDAQVGAPVRHAACAAVVDAGGLPTLHGRRVCAGRLYRMSGGLVRAGDLDRLASSGVGAVIDLRGPSEDRSQIAGWAAAAGVDYMPVPIEVAGSRTLVRAARRATDRAEAQRLLGMVYREILDGYARELALAIAVIAEGTPAAIGCAAGKDRTGVAIALVHALLGVGERDIVRSYSSAPPCVECLRELAARYFRDDLDAPHLEVVLSAGQATMRGALDYLRRTYGGAEAYLLANGLPRPAIEALRRDLVAE